VLKFEKPLRQGQPWSAEEDAMIRSLAATDAPRHLAKVLSRSVASIYGRAAFLRVKVSHKTPRIRD
jgi:hypothetical protein